MRRAAEEFEGKDGMKMSQFFHSECFFHKILPGARSWGVASGADLPGFDALKPEDQAAVTKLLEEGNEIKASGGVRGHGRETWPYSVRVIRNLEFTLPFHSRNPLGARLPPIRSLSALLPRRRRRRPPRMRRTTRTAARMRARARRPTQRVRIRGSKLLPRPIARPASAKGAEGAALASVAESAATVADPRLR